MKKTGHLLGASLLGISLLTWGCQVAPAPKPIAKAVPIKPPAKQSYWHEEEAKGNPSILINLSEQHAYFYEDDKVIGESSISSGKKGFDTPPGQYKVIQKDKNHVSNLYGEYVDEDGDVVQKNVDVTKDPLPDGAEFSGAKMPYFLRFTGGYGLHAGYVPKYRASHGCIRMPASMAAHFFDATQVGTPVTVKE